MRVHYRKSLRIGPRSLHVRFNISRAGASTTFQVGPWSWNTRSRRSRLDLPGGFHATGRRRGGAR